MMFMRFLIMIMFWVIVVMVAARRMIMIPLIARMAVGKAVGVLMHVFMQMIMRHRCVPMRVGVQVLVGMAVFMFMLQHVDGAGAALPERIG